MIESILFGLMGFALFFIAFVIFSFFKYIKTSPLHKTEKQSKYYEITILLGSGGHTGQLSLMLKNLHFSKANKLNVLITSTDKSSKTYFENLFSKEIQTDLKDKIRYFDITRTNEVKQSYLTAVFTTLKSMFNSLKMMRNSLLNTTHFVSNGPGTCVPFFLIFFVLKKMKLTKTKLIFIESWCRVDSISLSGKIARFFVDNFIVHWEEQKIKYPWTEYYGKIL